MILENVVRPASRALLALPAAHDGSDLRVA
jgi:hypothetical protein